MINKDAIFIFTKDRPETLEKTLDSIQHTPYVKYIVDDSVLTQNQRRVSNLSNSYLYCNYLGKAEFNSFINQYQIGFPKFAFLLREVGCSEWNLGYARNFALLYSKSLGLENVLFTDDDIQVPNPKLIEELFQSINNHQFTGANILGLIDDSVLGHIATDMGVINERMLSGGFMVFKPKKIVHFFLNNYNEDWIWLFLQIKGKTYLQMGEVLQELVDPLNNYETKAMFQEFGEVALDGVLDLHNEGSYEELAQPLFWERILKERAEYLNVLLSKATKEGKNNYCEIIRYVMLHSRNMDSNKFKTLFEKYLYDRELFQHLYNSLS